MRGYELNLDRLTLLGFGPVPSSTALSMQNAILYAILSST